MYSPLSQLLQVSRTCPNVVDMGTGSVAAGKINVQLIMWHFRPEPES